MGYGRHSVLVETPLENLEIERRKTNQIGRKEQSPTLYERDREFWLVESVLYLIKKFCQFF